MKLLKESLFSVWELARVLRKSPGVELLDLVPAIIATTIATILPVGIDLVNGTTHYNAITSRRIPT